MPNELELKPLEETKNLMIMLHGVGSDGHDLIRLAEHFQPNLPNTHFYSPHGIEKFDQADWGYQWFSLKVREEKTITNALLSSVQKTQAIIYNKLDELSLLPKDLILLGFSQGAMMATHLTLIQKDPIKCTVSFAGRLFVPELITNKKTPICLIHGQDDDIVPHDNMIMAEEILAKNNISYVTNSLTNLAHTIDSRGVNIATKFISQCM